MVRKPYEVTFNPEVARHIAFVESKYHSFIAATIAEQLAYEPEVPTRNRKPLGRPTTVGATWELRFGPDNRFRVFYRMGDDANEVRVVAIGIKRNNRLVIGGREIKV